MNIEYEIQEAFRRWGEKIAFPTQVFEGTIKDIDEKKFTCTVQTNSKVPVSYSKVPLKVLIGSQSSILEIPKKGTDCLARFKDNNIQRPILVSVHEVEKYLWKIGSKTLLVSNDGYVFNEGKLGGMVKAIELENQLNQNNSYLQTLQQAIQTALAAVDALIPGTSAAFISSMATTQVGNYSKLQNEDIKQ